MVSLGHNELIPSVTEKSVIQIPVVELSCWHTTSWYTFSVFKIEKIIFILSCDESVDTRASHQDSYSH